MLRIEDKNAAILRLQVDGKLQAGDYDAFVPVFEQLLRERDAPLPMRIELGADFDGWSLDGLWRELKFDFAHRRAVGPVAVIGDSRWERWGTELSGPFFKAPVRFFERDKAPQADAWLQQQLSAAAAD